MSQLELKSIYLVGLNNYINGKMNRAKSSCNPPTNSGVIAFCYYLKKYKLFALLDPLLDNGLIVRFG